MTDDITLSSTQLAIFGCDILLRIRRCRSGVVGKESVVREKEGLSLDPEPT